MVLEDGSLRFGTLTWVRALQRPDLLAEIAPRLRRYVLGETDSELVFFQFLSRLSDYGPLDRSPAISDVTRALSATVRRVREICDDGDHRALLTLIVTDGKCLAATQGGKPLFYSTFKGRCPDRDSCSSLSEQCEAPTRTGFVNHLIISSERLQGENIWVALEEGDAVAVDHRMQVHYGRLAQRQLPVLGAEELAAPSQAVL